MSIVRPDKEVRIFIFGIAVDRVSRIEFTTEYLNCSGAGIVVNYDDFPVRTNERVAVRLSFP